MFLIIFAIFRLATSLSKDKTVDNGRLNSLATVSRTARLEREKLAHRLEAEKNAEGKIQKRLFTARSTVSNMFHIEKKIYISCALLTDSRHIHPVAVGGFEDGDYSSLV